MSGDLQDYYTNISKLGGDAGYIVVNPTANRTLYGRSWSYLGDNDSQIFSIMERVKKVFHVMEERVHITGFSQGAGMTWRFICKYPHYIASAAPIGFGAGDPINFEEPVRIRKFKNDLKNNEIQSAVIYADREHFANMHYLTGFDPRFEEALLIINVSEDVSYLITGPENQGYSNISEINLIKKNFPTFGLLGQDRRTTSSLENILFECNLKDKKKCGVVGWKYFTSDEFEKPEGKFDIPNYILNSIETVSYTHLTLPTNREV